MEKAEEKKCGRRMITKRMSGGSGVEKQKTKLASKEEGFLPQQQRRVL